MLYLLFLTRFFFRFQAGETITANVLSPATVVAWQVARRRWNNITSPVLAVSYAITVPLQSSATTAFTSPPATATLSTKRLSAHNEAFGQRYLSRIAIVVTTKALFRTTGIDIHNCATHSCIIIPTTKVPATGQSPTTSAWRFTAGRSATFAIGR